ncbi:transporter substrate-binding domain-containing protein [Pseudomonas chlororaphis subsp. aurantiaca]|uniref:transporter substrate-binding domain-containing protein n=1 Tax=Pseudomonas chlororaphis TaxID=587753 RepID=UPI0027DE8EDE|nr:transporter substrate-binding domain-containing protein [Pseudomonas chlororaphis]WMI97633.1 transporter substrate-binding domain-containing protein [Pseudomonas chlororaphis subsp. aurantiaca]
MKHFWIIFFIFASHSVAAASDDVLNFSLINRSHIEPENLLLSHADKQWLEQKKTLRIGVSAPDYPPFDITTHNQEFEGITADYAGLVGEFLDVKIHITRYPNRTKLINALHRQEIDLVATANEYETVFPKISLSTPYAFDQPVLVAPTRGNSLINSDLSGKRIAMLYHYRPLATVEKFYPNAKFILYPSILKAVGAVTTGEADLYIGDSISTSYLINKSYLNSLEILNLSPLQVKNFSFAILHSNIRLKRIVNAALKAIPSSERLVIWRRWEAGGINISDMTRINFTPEEQRWMQQHPTLKVGINNGFMPFTFVDENGQFKGLSADILHKISLRSGLLFEAHQVSSIKNMIGQLQAGEFDLLATLSPSDERKKIVDFTRPYLSPPLVLVTASKPDAPHDLRDLSGKKMAIVQGNSQLGMLAKDFPEVRVVIAENLNEAFSMVANGTADATLSSLVSARYTIARMYADTLKVANTIGDKGNQVSFAINKNDPELLSILNKSLLNIAPEEMDEVSNRWRRPVVLNDSYWTRYGSTILKITLAVLTLLLGAFFWITSLRREVFKRKQAERALNDKLEFERVLLNGTPHPIYARDREAALLLCNKAYLDTLGVDDEKVLKGTTVIQGMLPDRSQAAMYHQSYLEVIESGEPRFEDRELTLASRKTITIYHWILPYRGSDGLVKGLIGGWLDVSERQRLMQQLHDAKQEADNANRAKTTFLATMSHEIRTPMNVVIGMLEMASKTAEQGASDRVAIELASEAAKGLLDLIGDILDIAHIESGHLDITPERANPQDLVMSTIRIFNGPATQKSLQLLTDIEPSANCDVLIDPMRFKQVLTNVLSNAIKFTNKGAIKVMVRATQQVAQKSMALEVKIQDDGIGIQPADQQRLFSPFTQINSPLQTPGQGTGLGLVISRTLMEMMEGTLDLSSEPSKGTLVTLRVDLPLLDDAPSPEEALVQETASSSTLNILIVDDFLANRIVLARQLRYLGHEVTEAGNGQEGLDLWNEIPFDVVVTDCNMPVMDGYELARCIRQLENQRNEPACLLLGFTANAVPQERLRCLNAGMDECLFKPISLSTLNAHLQVLQCANNAHDQELSSERLQERLMRLTQNDTQVMQTLWAELQDSHHNNLATLQTLIQQRDRQGLSNLAHLIKGCARIVQYDELIVCCENLEAACQANDDSDQLETTSHALKTCMLHFSTLLQGSPQDSGATALKY